MFGIYRYGLAFCVAISHLWAGMIGGPAAYAVWGFYCLSGYLMTLILNEKYGFSPRGLGRFAVNRVLRIYPAYFVVCVGMFVLFYLSRKRRRGCCPTASCPRLRGWQTSIFLMTMPDGGELVHGSGALRVELWFYVAMALGLARNRLDHGAWFAASVAYTFRLSRSERPSRNANGRTGMFAGIQLRQHDLSRPRLVAGDQDTVGGGVGGRHLVVHVWYPDIPGGPSVWACILIDRFGVRDVDVMRLEPRGSAVDGKTRPLFRESQLSNVPLPLGRGNHCNGLISYQIA